MSCFWGVCIFQWLSLRSIEIYHCSTFLYCDLASFFFFPSYFGWRLWWWGCVWLLAVSHLVEAPLICHDYCWVLACHWLQEINGFGLALCCMGRPNSLFFTKWGFRSIHPSLLSIQSSFSLCLSLLSQFINLVVYLSFFPNQCWHSASLPGIENTKLWNQLPFVALFNMTHKLLMWNAHQGNIFFNVSTMTLLWIYLVKVKQSINMGGSTLSRHF